MFRDVLVVLALFLSAALGFAQPSLPTSFQAKTVTTLGKGQTPFRGNPVNCAFSGEL
jgi:hypothetical protein